MAHKNRCPGIALRVAAMMLLVWNLQLSASTITWKGTGGNTAWGTSANWTCVGVTCNPGGMATALQNADVIFPASGVGSKLSPTDGGGANSTSGVTLDSLTIIGSEYTGFSVAAGITLTISNTTSNSSIGTGAGNAISNLGTITVTGLTGGTLSNASAIVMGSTGTLSLSSGATLINTGGTISNIAGGSFVIDSSSKVQNGTLLGAVTNSGTISSTGANSVTFGSAVVNGGALAGTLTTTGTANSFGATTAVTNTGTLLAGTGGSINWIGGTNSGTLGSGSGALTVTGTLANAGGTINGGTVTATVNGGTISGNIAGSGGTFNNVLFAGASLTNGSITGASDTATGTNTFAGSITNSGTLAINSGTSTVTGTITNTGTINDNGATLNIASGGDIVGGILSENSGVVTLSGTLDVATADLMGGAFDGTGAFDGGNVTNDGVDLDVNGSAATRGGTATLGDYDFTNYTQGAGGTLSINFDATSNDELIDSANTTLAGALDLLNQNGAALTFGSLTDTSYVLIADVGNAVSGTFSSENVTLPTGWSIVYNGANKPTGGGDVELDFTAPPATPEPATDILLGAAIVGLGLMRRKLVKR